MGCLLRGISPVVASVLLIAFSIAIATIVGTWAMSYTQDELESLQDESYCNDVKIEKLEFEYDSSKGEGMIRLQNSGEPITGYRIYTFNAGSQELAKEVTEELAKGDISTHTFQTSLSGVTEVLIEVSECPTVKLRLSV